MSGVLNMLVGSSSAFNFNATISANTTDYNLATAMTAAGWNGIDRVIATVTVNSGVYLGSSSTSTPALTVGTLPAASTVLITNNGFILGKGGNGAVPNSSNGSPGGPALTIQYATTITNNNIIGGGGGGGGYGCGAGAFDGKTRYSYMLGGGAGGGAGYLAGSGGTVSGTRQNSVIAFVSATNGSSGTFTAGGSGGVGDYGFAFGVSPNSYMQSGGGGSGGGLGSSGGGGGDGSWAGEAGFAYYPVRNPAASSGGAAGACTTSGSNANITWAATGTRYGALL